MPRIVGEEVSRPQSAPADMGEEFSRIYKDCAPHTLTSVDRMYAVYSAVNYVCARGIAGDIIECGVWRGGSAMVAAHTLLARGDKSRTIHLYDTYAGMVEPTDEDVHVSKGSARAKWAASRSESGSGWCFAPLDQVRANILGTGWPEDRVRFVVGRVEDTIPESAPECVALLRLDTDFYESTYHELVHLYPRVPRGGVVIIDDYGSWKGSAGATDRYFREQGVVPLMHRTDHTGRCLMV